MVFFVSGPNWPQFLAMQQKVLVETVRKLQSEGVRLAVPTQMMWVEPDSFQNKEDKSAFSN